jgi:Cytochrome P460
VIRWVVMCLVLAGAQPVAAPQGAATKAGGNGPQYTADGQMRFPTDYREWIFLSSGMDMSYQPSAGPAAHSVFDNVFVNPAAYRAFLQTGTWPEGTMMMLEVRGGEGNHSINVRGQTQSTEVMGMEIHVKDSAHVKGGWGFYRFNDKKESAKLIERPATCYTCHEAHGAVDTTFVQFYPTLLPLAKEKGTLSTEYLKDEAAAPAALPAAK